MNGERDPLLEALGALPARDVDPASAARIRQVALEALDAGRPSWLRRWGALWTAYLEPALALGLGAIYLTWAVRTVALPVVG